MRLWHIELIPVLPRAQLISQWRELAAIAGAIIKRGTPNHLLVNFVLDYDYDHFISYADLVRQEILLRGYKISGHVFGNIVSLSPNYITIPDKLIYPEIMTSEYLTICLYNLYEKYLRGGVSEADWQDISKYFKFK